MVCCYLFGLPSPDIKLHALLITVVCLPKVWVVNSTLKSIFQLPNFCPTFSIVVSTQLSRALDPHTHTQQHVDIGFAWYPRHVWEAGAWMHLCVWARDWRRGDPVPTHPFCSFSCLDLVESLKINNRHVRTAWKEMQDAACPGIDLASVQNLLSFQY